MDKRFGPNYPLLLIGLLPGVIGLVILIFTRSVGNLGATVVVAMLCILYLALIGSQLGAKVVLSDDNIIIKKSVWSGIKKIKWADIEKLNYLKTSAMGDTIAIKDKHNKKAILVTRLFSRNRQLIEEIIKKYSQINNIPPQVPSNLYKSSGWQMVLWLGGTVAVLYLARFLFIR